MKIYTGTGDKGTTGLFSGERVSKGDLRVETYGTLDELNANVGLIVANLPARQHDLSLFLQQIQQHLFQIGSWLATTPGSIQEKQLRPLDDTPRKRLEQAIDTMQQELPPLTHFILPGGHPVAAQIHITRTVCRRCERNLVRLLDKVAQESTEYPQGSALIYLNRLADYLFMLARYYNHLMQVPELKKG